MQLITTCLSLDEIFAEASVFGLTAAEISALMTYPVLSMRIVKVAYGHPRAEAFLRRLVADGKASKL